MMVSGLEGCWCMFIIAFICLPIMKHMSGKEGNKIHKDTLDTFETLRNSLNLSLMMVVVFILGCIYSFISITLIQRSNAVVQTLWKSFRTFLIQVTLFIIFISFRTNKMLYPYRLAGEEWVHGYYLKLIGFIVLIVGVLCYNKIPKYPCF